jgi:aspartyl-tRNA(Asn)/glutamyl-tRNA(Gln) amidotransferase subunit A
VSIARLAARLRGGEFSPTEAVRSYLDRIDAHDGTVNAYVTVRAEEALEEAASLERRGPAGSLWGVPLAVKDVIDVAGTPTTASSFVLGRGNVPARDACVVERLRSAGAIILGKLNTHEFAYGALTTSAYAGAAHNPWSLDRVCGGSSGGSGACAAADLAAGTLGTDTAGSIRIPAAFNGVTGLRPTYGRVSNRGVLPVAWSFDTVGPIAPSADDCALLLEAIAGHDPEDPTTADVPVPAYNRELDAGVDDLRIGVVEELFRSGVDSRVAAVAEAALEELGNAGAKLLRAEIGSLSHFGTIQQAMQFVEAAAAHLPWLRTRLPEYGADVRARLLTGLFLPSTTYVLGRRARRLADAEFGRALERVDLLVAPTMPTLPPRIGEETVELNGKTVPYRLTVIPLNSPWSCVGAPAMSVPAGFVDGLPVGLAFVGPRFGDATVIRAAHAFQRLTDWHERRPVLQPTEATA